MRLQESNPKERKTVLGHYKNAINIYFCSLTAGGAKACKSIEGVLRRPGQCRRRAEPCGGRHCCPLWPGAANPSAVAFSVQKLERRQCHNTDRHTTHSRQASARPSLARFRAGVSDAWGWESGLSCSVEEASEVPTWHELPLTSEENLPPQKSYSRFASQLTACRLHVLKNSHDICVVKIIFTRPRRALRANTASWMHVNDVTHKLSPPRSAKPTDGTPWGWATEPPAPSV